MIYHTIAKCRDQYDDHPENESIPEYSDAIQMSDISDETREDDFEILFHN